MSASTMRTISLGTPAVRCMGAAPTFENTDSEVSGDDEDVAAGDEADDDAEKQIVDCIPQ